MVNPESGASAEFFGLTCEVPMVLEAEALDSEGSTCHVCDARAKVIVEMLDPNSDIGSAIFLCSDDLALVTAGDIEQVAQRLATNYEDSAEQCRRTAILMTSGTGRSVALPAA